MSKKLSALGEFGLIDLIAKHTPGSSEVVKGIGDDTAVIRHSHAKNIFFLFTTDMLVEGTHFTRLMKPNSVGHKALACNVSDVAAMGGVPKFAVVSLTVPADLEVQYVKKIYEGINDSAKAFKVAIVGGDTVRNDKIIINVALWGEVKRNHVIYRRGARIGDIIFVTGPLGRSFQTGKHLTFTPRIHEAQFLVNHFKPSAMMDISDGLAADLGHILKASRVGAKLDETKIPKTKNATLKEALSDGEDFELLFTLNPLKAKDLLSRRKSFRFYPIGEIVDRREGLTLLNVHKEIAPLPLSGFKHF